MLLRRFSLASFAIRWRTMARAPSALASSKKPVECFYDVGSPYSWFGFEILCRYRHIWDIDLHFRPVFLGGIMKASGNQSPSNLTKRREYLLKDIRRMAKYYQVPVHTPKDFMGSIIQKGSLSAMRFVTAVDVAQPQFLEAVSKELWMRIWSRNEDIGQPENLLAAAEKAGFPSDKGRELLEMSTSPAVKNRLREATDEVLKLGAFGLPCFLVHVDGEPELLFGSDRLELLASLLGEKWLGPVPTTPKL